MISHCFDEREDAAPHWQQVGAVWRLVWLSAHMRVHALHFRKELV
jgi:hypothetical protein